MVGLPLTILLTISISFFFFYQKKGFTFIENSIIYMVITILTTNVTTILNLNLKLVKTTIDPLLFPAVLLYRDVIIPLLVLNVVNFFYVRFTLVSKNLYLLLIFMCLNGIGVLLNFLDVVQFIRWNYFYAAVVNITYIIIGLGIAKFVVFVSKRSS